MEKNLKGLTSQSQPSPSSDTAPPEEPGGASSSPVDGSRAGKGLGKWENLHSSQQRSPDRWLVASQETPRRAHPDRRVPSKAGGGQEETEVLTAR